jgi:hypothetical protein
MNARTRLFDAYAEWRRWTVEEGDAIRRLDWPRVRTCQRAKLELQPRILRFTDDARVEAGPGWPPVEKDLRRELSGLIELETANGCVLDQARAAARAEEAELDGAARKLRRVRSYAPVQATAWNTYS